MLRFKRILLLIIVVTTKSVLADIPAISMAGIAFEGHETFANTFLVVNQQFTNHLYYELRGNLIVTYPVLTLSAFIKNTQGIPPYKEGSETAVGGTGILGYIFDINPKVNFMPYIRVQELPNTVLGYKDTLGNTIASKNYTGFLGGEIKIRDQRSIFY